MAFNSDDDDDQDAFVTELGVEAETKEFDMYMLHETACKAFEYCMKEECDKLQEEKRGESDDESTSDDTGRGARRNIGDRRSGLPAGIQRQ